MAMHAAMNHFAIGRLRYTFDALPAAAKQIKDEITSFLDNAYSYKVYRDALSNSNPPCIPFLGVYLQHLTSIEEGNPDKIGDLINFYKRTLVSRIIDELKQFQQLPYNFQPVKEVYALVKSLPIISNDDKSLYKLSLAREPKNAQKYNIK